MIDIGNGVYVDPAEVIAVLPTAEYLAMFVKTTPPTTPLPDAVQCVVYLRSLNTVMLGTLSPLTVADRWLRWRDARDARGAR